MNKTSISIVLVLLSITAMATDFSNHLGNGHPVSTTAGSWNTKPVHLYDEKGNFIPLSQNKNQVVSPYAKHSANNPTNPKNTLSKQ